MELYLSVNICDLSCYAAIVSVLTFQTGNPVKIQKNWSKLVTCSQEEGKLSVNTLQTLKFKIISTVVTICNNSNLKNCNRIL